MKYGFLFVLFFACFAWSNAQIKVLSPDAFEKDLQLKKVQILDVRSSDEFKNNHLPNALQADWLNQSEFLERTKYLDSNLPVYIYCQAGVRSHNAAVYLSGLKHFKVFELEGGISNWMAQGKSVEMFKKFAQISTDSLKTMVSAKGLCLVDFNAKWCAPCVRMKPSIDSLSQHYQTLSQVLTIDGAIQTDLLKPMQISGFPTLVLFKNGLEVWRQQGFMSFDDLLAKLKSFQ